MRLEPEWRCANWASCTLRQQYGGDRCYFMGRHCEHLKASFSPVGREIEVVAHPRVWGTSLGIVIPKRTVERLGIEPGDEVRLLISKQRTLSKASMPPPRPGRL